ncbi:acetyl esterase [Kaistia soli DSM 19436]|uniref:Acetyl esterase n=1 Tax=Kaistia soli DSM 19436 TaxID=1122133 RepID=A0A1M4WWM6_9HYPH|nr:alpha/beta hydrolase [Kaistia soli]SHE85646.1 acetyl esterase [Kaistia soli DSM 19436]
MLEEIIIPEGKPARPLDPTLAALAAARASQPQVFERPLDEARRLFIEARLPLRTGDGILTEDRTIPGPAGPIPVRLYRRPGAERPLPILVYFHGGGFVLGNLDSHDIVCRRFAARADWLVLSVDYRLAPEYPYPAPVDDAYAGLLFAANSGETIGGDPARIALAGDSAGGMLVLATALRARDEDGPAIAGMVPFYPMADLIDIGVGNSYRAFGSGIAGLSTRDIDWFVDCYVPDRSRRGEALASPVRAESFAGLPPALVVLAEHDVLYDEGRSVALRMSEAGVPVLLVHVSGVNHGFVSLDIGLPEEAAVFNLAAPWLARRLGL